MQKAISLFLTLMLFMATNLFANPVQMQGYREHATDCTSLTDGRYNQICHELDSQRSFKCVPSVSGELCDTSGEWELYAVGTMSGFSEINTTTATAGRIFIADGTDFESVAVSGDCTLASNGQVTCTELTNGVNTATIQSDGSIEFTSFEISEGVLDIGFCTGNAVSRNGLCFKNTTGSDTYFNVFDDGNWGFAIVVDDSREQSILGTHDNTGNSIIISNALSSAPQDHDRPAQTDPTLFGFSDTPPNTANDEWWSLTHDKTNAVFNWGSGSLTTPQLVNCERHTSDGSGVWTCDTSLTLTDLSDVNSSTTTAGRILVADGTDWESMQLQGDCTMNGAGFISCTTAGDLDDLSDVNSSTVTAGRVLVADGTDWESMQMQGDCSMSGAGFVTCTSFSGSVTIGGTNDRIAGGDYSNNYLDFDDQGSGYIDVGGTFTGSTFSDQMLDIMVGQIRSAIDNEVLLVAFKDVGTTETDFSGNSHDGTYTGSYNSSDQSRQGFIYKMGWDQSSDSYIDFGDDDDFTFGDGSSDSAFSVCFSTNVTSDGASGMVITKRDATTSSELQEYSIHLDGSEKVVVNLFDNSVDIQTKRQSDGGVSDGWHVVCSTYDGTGGATAGNGITIYQDGAVKASTATNDASYVAMENTAQELYMGVWVDSGGNLAAEYGDDMGFLLMTSDVLTATEVDEIYRIVRGFHGI